MRKSCLISAGLFFLVSHVMGYHPHDTGWITFIQPNKTSFTAKSWGDIFFSWSEASSGDRIIQKTDGYWCYAVLDQDGEFTASDSIVGINDAPKSSYKLERSASRIAILEAEKEAYEDALDSLAIVAGLREDPYTLGLFFFQFDDVKKTTFSQGPVGYSGVSRNSGYLASDFEEMLFSTGRSYSTEDSDAYSVAGFDVHGSLADYYNEQTLGDVTFSAGSGVINEVNADTIVWGELPYSKSYYDSAYGVIGFMNYVQSYFSLDSLIGTGVGEYDKIALIYAGESDDGGLNPAMNPTTGNFYQVAENKLLSPTGFRYMGQIGPHAHEFGHTIGLSHVSNINVNFPFYWNMMGVGDMLGWSRNGTCPSGINPIVRMYRDWITESSTLTSDTIGFKLEYNYDSPIYVKIPRTWQMLHPNGSGDTLTYSNDIYLENRLREKFDKYTPIPENRDDLCGLNDPNDLIGGLLIWDENKDLIVADNHIDSSETWGHWAVDSLLATYASDNWPIYQGQDFNTVTLPSVMSRL